MRKFEMPSTDTEKTEYAGEEPQYENKSIMKTEAGEKVVVMSYFKDKGLYVVMNVDKQDTVSPAYKIHPDKLTNLEDEGEENKK